MKKAIFSLAVFVTMCCLTSCGGKTTSTTVTNDFYYCRYNGC